jgi:antirestriction protein ArdC
MLAAKGAVQPAPMATTTIPNQMNNQPKTNVYQIVTDRIIDRLALGEVPWINTRTKPLLSARSATTGKQYRGINAFLLSNTAQSTSAYWITYKTAAAMKGQVKKGSKSELCVFWKRLKFEDPDAQPGEISSRSKEIPMIRYYNVFNLAQVEGIADPLLDAVDIPDPIAKADELIAGFAGKPEVIFGSAGKAFYSPALDQVVMPQQSSFSSSAQFYRTYFHELVHATGAKSRLDRFDATPSEGADYGLEELVAEMGAAMLLAECGIFEETFEKNASYCQHWINALKGDSKLIVKAAGKAQKAVDLILGRAYSQEDK